jgi:hypothetical protein
MFIPVFIAPASADDFDTPGITPLPVPDVSNLEVWNVQEPMQVPLSNGGTYTYDRHLAAYVEGYGVVRVPANSPDFATSELQGSNVPLDISRAIMNNRPVNRTRSDDALISRAGMISMDVKDYNTANAGWADVKFVGDYFGQNPNLSPEYVGTDSIYAYCAGGAEGMQKLGYELTTRTGTKEDLDGTKTTFDFQVWQRINTGIKP